MELSDGFADRARFLRKRRIGIKTIAWILGVSVSELRTILGDEYSLKRRGPPHKLNRVDMEQIVELRKQQIPWGKICQRYQVVSSTIFQSARRLTIVLPKPPPSPTSPRDLEIKDRYLKGESYAKIGSTLNSPLSRERIRQIVQKNSKLRYRVPPGGLTTQEVAKMLGLGVGSIRELGKRGRIHYFKLGAARFYDPGEVESLKEILSQRPCKFCGNPVNSCDSRKKFCSPDCCNQWYTARINELASRIGWIGEYRKIRILEEESVDLAIAREVSGLTTKYLFFLVAKDLIPRRPVPGGKTGRQKWVYSLNHLKAIRQAREDWRKQTQKSKG